MKFAPLLKAQPSASAIPVILSALDEVLEGSVKAFQLVDTSANHFSLKRYLSLMRIN